jgi:hypothetical protein
VPIAEAGPPGRINAAGAFEPRPTPGHRYQPVMVYDRARRRTVLDGGIGDTSDTWEWDGRRWARIG